MNFIKERKQIHNTKNYHKRHYVRSKKRAHAIINNIGNAGSILDIGCNQGLTSRLLIENTQVKKVTGIELSKATVDADLMQDSRFELIEGDICDLSLDSYYDVVIYGAVHHHILGKHGLGVGVRVLQKIAGLCKEKLFFETGHITEGGRWAWQRQIRKYFRTDEEHIFYLLRSIEDKISSFEVIGSYWIHGSRRWLLCITMRNKSDVDNFHVKEDSQQLQFLEPEKTERFVRTFGSKNQKLIPLSGESHDSAVEFEKQTSEAGTYFIKKALYSKISLVQEYQIGNQLNEKWAVQPLGMPTPDKIVFPFIKGIKISDYLTRPLTPATRKLIAEQVLSIWNNCQKISLDWPQGFLIPIPEAAVLADVVDLNPNNFIVEDVKGQPMIRVVDFEPQSNHYRWKNNLHITRLLLMTNYKKLRVIVLGSVGLFLGASQLLKYESQPIEKRIRDRQPSLCSVVTARIRTLSGRILVFLIPSLYEK